EALLEVLHVLADRGGRQVQLVGRACEVQMARRDLEGSQRVQRQIHREYIPKFSAGLDSIISVCPAIGRDLSSVPFDPTHKEKIVMNRRCFAALAALSLASRQVLAGPENLSDAPASRTLRRSIEQQLAALDRASRGRLGVAILDAAPGARFAHRTDQRVLMCSTFKLLASAFVLRRVDQGQESLDRRIAYDATALLAWSPVTEKHVGDGMTLGALC